MAWKYYPYFTEEEMRCHCGQCDLQMKPEFMDRFLEMRIEANFPFIITSGARCPKYNTANSDSGINGPHTTGLAADVHVIMENAFRFLQLAIKHGMTGIGVSQRGDFSKRFIHVDCLKDGRPRIWSY